MKGLFYHFKSNLIDHLRRMFRIYIVGCKSGIPLFTGYLNRLVRNYGALIQRRGILCHLQVLLFYVEMFLALMYGWMKHQIINGY